jgi:hypothetical protein
MKLTYNYFARAQLGGEHFNVVTLQCVDIKREYPDYYDPEETTKVFLFWDGKSHSVAYINNAMDEDTGECFVDKGYIKKYDIMKLYICHGTAHQSFEIDTCYSFDHKVTLSWNAFICRTLVHENRAHVKEEVQENNHELSIVLQFITDTSDDIFRDIITEFCGDNCNLWS